MAPVAAPHVEHVYHLYVVETDQREALQQRLRARGIDTGIHYPVPAHLQEACSWLGYEAGDFEIDFPKAFTRQLKILRLLPYGMYFKLIKKSTGL